MDKEHIESVIGKYNPWRRGVGMGYMKPPAFRRAIFDDVRDALMSKRRITLITGPYGVGKSKLLLQLVEDLLHNDTPPEKIIYFSFGEPSLWGTDCDVEIRELLNRFGRDLEDGYLFIDDIHRWPGFKEQLPNMLDGYPEIFLVVAEEPLPDAGGKRRINKCFNRIKIPPLSFADYFFLNLAEKEGFDKAEVIKTGYQNLKTDFYKLFVRHFSEHIEGLPVIPQIEKGAADLLSLINRKLPLKIEIDGSYSERVLASYFATGGLPELWAIDNPMDKNDYVVRNYVEPVVWGSRDSGVSLKPEVIRRIIYDVMVSSGSETSLREIAKSVNTESGDVEAVLSYLHDIGLLSLVYRFGVAKRCSAGNFLPTLFDIGFYAALSGVVTSEGLNRSVRRPVMLNLVYNQIAEWDDILTVTYYRDGNGRIPGFVALPDSGRELPVFISDVSDEDTVKTLARFIEKRNITYGILISESGDTRFANHILHIPLHHFLLFFAKK
ncbi:MAG: ATP-binding protein [bacterium]|nr:ATP-binding protein [bacterium]